MRLKRARTFRPTPSHQKSRRANPSAPGLKLFLSEVASPSLFLKTRQDKILK